MEKEGEKSMDNNYFIAKGINISTRTIDKISYVFMEDKKELLQFNETGNFILIKLVL